MTQDPHPLFRTFAFVGITALTSTVHAQPAGGAAECIDKHEQAQVHRIDGRLLESKSSLLACASDQCPSFVRSDCMRWLDEIQSEIPTVIFEALGDGGSLTDVTVLVDGRELTPRLQGRAHELDPGTYAFEFRLSTGETKTSRVLVRQGERNKIVSVDFRSAPSVVAGGSSGREQPLAPPPVMERPVPTSVYVAGGIAAVATAGFIGLGITAKVKESNAKDSCAPNCSEAEVDDIKTFALAADLSLGVAAASALTAAVLYFNRPSVEKPPAAAASWRPAVSVAPGGGGWLGLSGAF